MDPVSLILGALAAGATSAVSDAANEAVKEAYTSLKAVVKKLFAGKPQAETVLAEYEKDPDTWEKPLQKSLVEVHADRDEELIRQAQQLMKLINPQQAARGKYNVQIGEGKGVVIGDHGKVVFGEDHMA